MMLRIGSTLALAAALLCAGLVPVRAQTPGGAPIAGSASGYSVDNVAVEASAGNATEARAKAFAQGPRKGLQQLLQQIGADPARVSGMSDADVERLVQSFQVKSEQASPGHYSANLAYTFRSSGVQQLLAGGGAAPPITATAPGHGRRGPCRSPAQPPVSRRGDRSPSPCRSRRRPTGTTCRAG